MFEKWFFLLRGVGKEMELLQSFMNFLASMKRSFLWFTEIFFGSNHLYDIIKYSIYIFQIFFRYRIWRCLASFSMGKISSIILRIVWHTDNSALFISNGRGTVEWDALRV